MKLRKMTKRDLKAVVSLEQRISKYSLNEQEAAAYLYSASIMSMVVELDKEIVGFSFVSIKNDKYVIQRLGVDAEHRKKLIATLLMNHVKENATKSKDRQTIEYVVREKNLGGQLFLKRHGFIAIEVLKEYWGNEDGYKMVWRPK